MYRLWRLERCGEELFFLDGRDMISHPQHGLFTGLLNIKACSQLMVTNG